MSHAQAAGFGVLLKRFRVAAGLTQDALAERAGISVRAVSDLERGARRSPHHDTVELLAAALGISEQDRALLLRAAARPPRAVRGAAISEPLPAPTIASVHATDSPTPNPLAVPLTPLVGREHEEGAAVHLMGREDVRLLTLVGPPGIGKTRLALQVATSLRDQFEDGVAFVALAAAREAALVLPAIAGALGLSPTGSAPLGDYLSAALREKRMLLVLDNFEQVISGAPAVADLLTGCPSVKALVTSRAPLRVRGEHVLAVPPLELPSLTAVPPLTELVHYSAVALFVQRARALRPTFVLSEATAATAVAICHRLDGIPLAIELAAPRITLLSLPDLLARLEHGFSLDTRGAVDLPERQRTLRHAIAWSYDLLDATAQRVLRWASVFAGGFTAEAVEAVCATWALSSPHVLDALDALVDQSLLVSNEVIEGELRFGMLETIREYAGEALRVCGEAGDARRRHAEYYRALAEMAAPHLKGPDQEAWLLRLEREHDNLRAALAWACELRVAEEGLRLASALWWFWQLRGHMGEGRRWSERVLALGEGENDAGGVEASADRFRVGTLRAKALEAAGNLAFKQDDYERAEALLEQGLALYREQENRAGIADVLNVLGLIAQQQGKYDLSVTLFEESLALRRELGATRGIGAVLTNLGIVAYHQADYARAVALYEEAAPLFRALGDKWATAMVLNNLAEAARFLQQRDRAVALFEESLAMFRDLGDRRGMGMPLNNLGYLAVEEADYGRAIALLLEALDLNRSVGSRVGMLETLEELAFLFSRQSEWRLAARIYGMTEAQRAEVGSPVPQNERDRYEQSRAEVVTALGAEAFARACDTGRSLTVEQVLVQLRG